MHEPRTVAQSDFEEEAQLRWRRPRNVHQELLQEVHVTSVRGVLVRDLAIERVGRHGQLPLRTPDALVEPIDALVMLSLNWIAANAPDPLERCGQVDGHVRILGEGASRSRARPTPCTLNGKALGAQQTQRRHVTVKDIDGRETALEAVELEEGDSTGRLVALLVKTRVVPEEEHLSVCQIHRLENWVVIPIVAGVIEVRQELAHIAEELVARLKLTRPSPAIRKDDDEHRILCDGSRIGGSFWQCAARGHDEWCSGALRLG